MYEHRIALTAPNPEMTVRYMGPEARYLRPAARGGWYNRGEHGA
jgi:hypothetical protein